MLCFVTLFSAYARLVLSFNISFSTQNPRFCFKDSEKWIGGEGSTNCGLCCCFILHYVRVSVCVCLFLFDFVAPLLLPSTVLQFTLFAIDY